MNNGISPDTSHGTKIPQYSRAHPCGFLCFFFFFLELEEASMRFCTLSSRSSRGRSSSISCLASASAGGPGSIMLEIIGATHTRLGSGARLSHVSGQGVPPARNETSCKAGPPAAIGVPPLVPKKAPSTASSLPRRHVRPRYGPRALPLWLSSSRVEWASPSQEEIYLHTLRPWTPLGNSSSSQRS